MAQMDINIFMSASSCCQAGNAILSSDLHVTTLFAAAQPPRRVETSFAFILNPPLNFLGNRAHWSWRFRYAH